MRHSLLGQSRLIATAEQTGNAASKEGAWVPVITQAEASGRDPLLPKRGQHSQGSGLCPPRTRQREWGVGWGVHSGETGWVGPGFRAAQLEKARLPPGEQQSTGSGSPRGPRRKVGFEADWYLEGRGGVSEPTYSIPRTIT